MKEKKRLQIYFIFTKKNWKVMFFFCETIVTLYLGFTAVQIVIQGLSKACLRILVSSNACWFLFDIMLHIFCLLVQFLNQTTDLQLIEGELITFYALLVLITNNKRS